MNKSQIDEFETVVGQLEAFHQEMNTLVKKNPNDTVNKFKLRLINTLILRSNKLLGKERLPFPDFETFDETALPSTSDALIIISQYLSVLEKLRMENIHNNYGTWYWIIEERRSKDMQTSAPKRF